MEVLLAFFKNPSEKLQKLLACLFAITTVFETIAILISQFSAAGTAFERHLTGQGIYCICLAIFLPCLVAFINWVSCLFTYVILDFFKDVHRIADSQEKN